MPESPESQHEHGSPRRLGVLLVNLGTPDAPTPAAVRRFLAEFLWDRRVVDAPRWLWWLALHAVILRVRPAKSAHAYRQIWTSDGSPLLVHSRALAERVGAALGATRSGFDTRVALGMSYGSPSIRDALAQLRSDGARRLVVLPLYPQYSNTTTASAFDRVTTELQRWCCVPDLHFIAGYHDEPAYIDAVCASIQEHWRTRERTHLLFSFHGLPQRYVQAGDPYHEQCLRTARLVAARLALGEADWSISFQSRVGREEWLRPYTDELLLQYARSGPRRITVVCPGFATDCLETLEEIAIRNRAAFLASGGESCDYVPALNADDAHVRLLVDLIERHSEGWRAAPVEACGAQTTGQRAGAAR